MMIRSATLRLLPIAALLSMTCVSSATADDSRFVPRAGSWFTQNGPISITFRDKSDVSVNGSVVAGLEANPKDNITMSNSIGYNFTPNISGQLVLGVTPTTDVMNQSGTKLGEVTYGAPSLLLDYRVTRFGAIQPFAGVGLMYLFFRDEKDAALTNLKVDDAFGLIVRGGLEVMVTADIGFYGAANRVFIDTTATGNLGANSVKADLELDPWIFQFGMSYRF